MSQPTENTPNAQEVPAATTDPDSLIESKLFAVIEEKRQNIDELTAFAKDMLVKKRAANAEAEEMRLKYEALQNEKTKAEMERQQAEMAEADRLRLQLEQANQQLEAVRKEAERKSAEKAQMELNHAIEKHKATDPKYIEFLLREELNVIGKDPDLLSTFSVDKWMAEKKNQMPHIFQQPAAPAAPPPPASTGLPPAQPAGTTYQPQTPRIAGPDDVKNLTNDWLQFKASLPTR